MRILSIYAKEEILERIQSNQPRFTLSKYTNKRRHYLKDEDEDNSELLNGFDKTGFNNELLKVVSFRINIKQINFVVFGNNFN